MIFHRTLIGGAAAAPLSPPSILRAHTQEPFVLANEFHPREVRVCGQYAPGQIMFFPRNSFCTKSSTPNARSPTALASARQDWPSRDRRSSNARRDGRPSVRRTI